MMKPLRIECDKTGLSAGVVTIYLDEPDRPVTVLNRDMIERLDATLDAVGPHPKGLVLATSHARVFVAGADLAEINSLSDIELDDYLASGQRVLGRIAALSCCSVAALNGAALGGGLELALHCDVLLAQTPANPDKPYRVGLPEASLGLCPGWGGTNTLPARIEPGIAIGATACGSTFTLSEAAELGLVSELFPTREDLLAAAKQRATDRKPSRVIEKQEPINISCSDISPKVRTALTRVRGDLPKDDAANAVAECIEAGLSNGWKVALEHERSCLISLRKSETARMKIKAFFDRTTSR